MSKVSYSPLDDTNTHQGVCANHCFRYLANLTMTTPLSALLDHGRELSCQHASSFGSGNRASSINGTWILADTNSATSAALFDEGLVSSDILAGSPVALERYYCWLVEFRRIVESIEYTNSQKRSHVEALMNSQRYPDITYALGGTDAVIAASFPSYLMYLEDIGVSRYDVQALRLAGIDNRYALACLDFRTLVDLMRETPGCTSPLYQHWQSTRMVVANAPAADAVVLANLRDPFIQTLY